MFRVNSTEYVEHKNFSYSIKGDYIYIGYHSGGYEKNDIVYQLENTLKNLSKTLETIGVTFDDIVQININLRSLKDFRAVCTVFYKFFKNGIPNRIKTKTKVMSKKCLCTIDAVVYKKHSFSL